MNEGVPIRTRPPHKALSARSVQSVTATGKTQRIADGGGLYLLVAPSGTKSWVLRTLIHGRRCDLGLGSAALVTLADARDQALALRRVARKGGDPLAERQQTRRAVPTFENAATSVHTAHAASFKNAKHRKQWLASLGDAFAAFGAKRVDSVTSADILSAVSPRWVTHPETSRRVLQRIRTVFEWCKAQGYCTGDNPTQGLTKVLPKHRGNAQHHAALPYPQVPSFLRALHAADAGEALALAFEFLILTASRTSEVLLAEWSEIDFETKTWTIPASRMKAGVGHRVPLAPRCLKILRRAESLSDGGPYVFPGRTPQKPLSNMAFLMALRRLGQAEITAHGFRSTFRDWTAEKTSVPRAVCEAALAHTLRDKTEAAYHRTDLFDRRRELMASWAAFATSEPTRKVVSIRRQRN